MAWIETISVIKFIDVVFSIESFIVVTVFFTTALFLLFHKIVSQQLLSIGLILSIATLILIDVNANILTKYEFGILLEHGLRIGIPIITLLFLNEKLPGIKTIHLLKICLSFVFIGHGLYAIGIHDTPTSFSNMISFFFNSAKATTDTTLLFIGIFDIVAGVLFLIFTKNRLLLVYLFVWATIATGARFITGVSQTQVLTWVVEGLPEITWRIIHVATPLYLLKQLRKEKQSSHELSA